MDTKRVIKVLLILAMVLGGSQAGGQNKSARLSYQASKEVLLLGVYHFDNPGRDTYNLEIGDYFTKKRQAEIQKVVAGTV